MKAKLKLDTKAFYESPVSFVPRTHFNLFIFTQKEDVHGMNLFHAPVNPSLSHVQPFPLQPWTFGSRFEKRHNEGTLSPVDFRDRLRHLPDDRNRFEYAEVWMIRICRSVDASNFDISTKRQCVFRWKCQENVQMARRGRTLILL